MLVQPGDEIRVREGSRKRTYFKELDAVAESKTVPHWLDRNLSQLEGKVLQNPERGDVDASLNEQLIVEYYSR
jgi:small subunit ribosomal protein S4